MKHGYLSAYFSGVAAKILSAVEIRPERSHQHEFNGSAELIRLLGTAGQDKRRFAAHFLYLREDGEAPVSGTSAVTWYDARARSAARTGRSEHRLYFPQNDIVSCARQGDLLLIARRQDETLLFIIAEKDSTMARQLQWLFGLTAPALPSFSVRDELETDQDRLGVTATLVLNELGIDADLSDERFLEDMLREFGEGFPSTRAFSAYARKTLHGVAPEDDPDSALMTWMDREEVLFRTLEKYLVGARLGQGFLPGGEPDIDGFMSFSLSVQNRRKARAGAALENHLETLFRSLGIQYERGALTERNNRPDFLFPGGRAYHDAATPPERLTMLAAKTTAKDRWRQITKEADRITLKHLLTLEPAISEKQTDQMRESAVQLVVPSSIHGEYTPAQCTWLMSLGDFIGFVQLRERR